MRCKTPFGTLILLAALPLSAMAADEQPADPSSYDNMPPPAAGSTAEAAPLFLQLDSDQDGYVSKDEAKRSADTAAQFDDLDANHDGKISATEFGAAGAK